ncbi:nucleoprotein TPR-like isoform X2 [Lytechinus variegatus]|uniref:nucleoprotein TPR-like isoform X2 n=1 Tax=Lytechinus variegatus TaxID=7654 RepID=UPI001BB17D31|nr:nucleoprotein TPR-like isoform X2 [Lytechinus variegatus]
MAGDSENFKELAYVLSGEELNSLPEEVKLKLEKLLSSNTTSLNTLKTSNERLKINSEQRYEQLEKQLIAAHKKLETESTHFKDAQKKAEELESQLQSAKLELVEFKGQSEGTASSYQELARVSQQLEAEKQDLVGVVERKSKQLEQLQDEWNSMSEKLSSANAARTQLQMRLDELENEDVSWKYREKRLQQEIQGLSSQTGFLQAELEKKTNEVLTLRKEKSNQILQLQSQLNDKSDECKHALDSSENLRKVTQDQAKRIEELGAQVKEGLNVISQNEEQFQAEIQAQNKLSNLYKRAGDEAESRVKELITAVEELRGLLKQATEATSEMETSMKDQESSHAVKAKEMSEKISKLERELEDANDLLAAARKRGVAPMSDEELSNLCPTAAAASSFIKSGMTLTEIYSQYVKTSDELMMEKQENQRLNMYMDQILAEIEEKAPVLQKQREDYEQALETVTQLSSKLEAAMLEGEQLRINVDDSERRVSHLGRENARLKQKNTDLSQQVRVLVREVSEARGGPIQAPDQMDVSSSDISSSSQVISDTLVSFRSVEELQQQNERLLGVVRDLSEKQEKEESETLQSKTADLKKQLDEAIEELDDMRSARSRQTEMVESIVRQRDMYRVLLAQTGASPPPLPTSPFTTPNQKSPHKKSPLVTTASQKSPGLLLPSDQETKKAFDTLQTEFDTYRREKGENERMLNDQLETLRKELSEFRVQNTKLSSQLDFSSERYNVLQSNVEGYKKEIAALADKNQKFSSQVVTLQQSASSITQDMLAAQEKLNKAEVEARNLKDENKLLKEMEIRLTQEKESMLREHKNQGLFLTNLQQIQNNLERSEFESKTRMTNQLEAMERELSLVRRKLDGETDQHQTVLKSWMGKVQDLQRQLNSELNSHQRTRNDLAKMRNDLQNVRQQAASTDGQLVALQVKLESAIKEKNDAVTALEQTDGGVTSVSETELKEVNNKLRMAENQIKILREQMKKLQEQRAHYQSISKSVEQNMKEQNEASETFKTTMEKRLQEVTQERDDLHKEVTELRKDREEKESENKELHVAVQTQTAELRRNLANLQDELKEALARQKEAEAKELTARQDSQTQAKLAEEMQDKYEREFLLHAADMKQLVTVKEQLASHNSKMAEVEEVAKKLQTSLDSSETSWKEQLRIQKAEVEQLAQRNKELENQNQMLHQQLEALSNRMLKQSSHAKDFANTSISLREEDKSAEQLLDVIKFLRREKELAESRFELAQTETLRLKHKSEHLQNQLEQAQKSLSGERERAQVLVQSSAQHQDLMKKVQSLNVVTDSNRLLREEKERLEQQLQQLKAKVSELEAAIIPRQEQTRTITAQRDALAAEKVALSNEVNRWKQRTNQLIEKSNRTDPEEYKKLLAERDQNKKLISEKTEEIMRHKADVSRLKSELGQQKTEISRLHMTVNSTKNEKSVVENSLKAEIASVKASFAAKQDELVNKDKTINQVKKIGRRYKAQYEEVKLQFDKLQEEVDKEKTATPQPDPETEAKVKSLEEEVTKLKEQNTQLKSAEDSAKALQSQLTEKEEQIEKSKKLMQNVRQKINNLSADKEKLTAENNKFKNQIDEMRGEISAFNGLMNQQERSQATQKSEYESRIQELQRELEDSRQTLQRALEEQQHQEQVREIQPLIDQSDQTLLSQPGTSGTSDRQSTSREEAPPTANIRPMASPASSVGQSKGTSSQSTAKVTASIRPIAVTRMQTGVTFITTTMATPTTMVTPMATVMPQTIEAPVSDQGSEQEDSNDQPFQQDTATVAPLAPATPIQAVQPTQQTPPTAQTPPSQQTPPMAAAERRTTDQQDPQGQETHRDDDTGPSGGQTGGSSSSPGSAAAKRPRDDPTDGDTTTTDREGQPPNEKRQRVAPQPQVSRDEPEEKEDEKEKKPEQTETTATETTTTTTTPNIPAQQVETEAAQEVEAETQFEVETAANQEVEPSQSAPETRVLEVSPTEQQATQERQDEETGESKSDDVVIVVDSDEDTGGVDSNQDQADQEGDNADADLEGEEEVEEEVDDDDDEEEFEGDIGEEDGEEDDAFEEAAGEDVDVEYEDEEGEEEMDDDEEEEEEEMEDTGEDNGENMEDDIVEIIDDDDQGAEVASEMDTHSSDQQSEAPQPMEAQQIPRVPPPQLRVVPPDPTPTSSSQEQTSSTHAPLLQRHGMRTERLGSQGRLPPFSLLPSGGGTPFEDVNDDGQVPSTPTLFVPHRGNDGFAEAINSPLLPVRFQFEGDSRSPAPGLAQLATQGDLGMDDTRINLMVGEDEASGRSVPTTPLQTTAPVTLLASGTSPSEGLEGWQSVPATRTSITPPPSGKDEPDTEPDKPKPGVDQAGTGGGQPESGTASEDKPGPSSGDATATETARSEPSSTTSTEGDVRPKPTPIVWSNSPSQSSSQSQSGLSLEQRPRNVAHRGNRGRGRMLNRNVAYRGRGNRGGPRTQWK